MSPIATSKNIAQLSLLNTEAIIANARWENRSWKDDADPKRRLELKREKVRARIAYRRFFLMFACQGAPHGLLPSNRTDSLADARSLIARGRF